MVTEMSKLWTDPVFLATISGGQTNGAVADPANGSIMAIRGGAAPAGSPATAKPGPDKTAKLLAQLDQLEKALADYKKKLGDKPPSKDQQKKIDQVQGQIDSLIKQIEAEGGAVVISSSAPKPKPKPPTPPTDEGGTEIDYQGVPEDMLHDEAQKKKARQSAQNVRDTMASVDKWAKRVDDRSREHAEKEMKYQAIRTNTQPVNAAFSKDLQGAGFKKLSKATNGRLQDKLDGYQKASTEVKINLSALREQAHRIAAAQAMIEQAHDLVESYYAEKEKANAEQKKQELQKKLDQLKDAVTFIIDAIADPKAAIGKLEDKVKGMIKDAVVDEIVNDLLGGKEVKQQIKELETKIAALSKRLDDLKLGGLMAGVNVAVQTMDAEREKANQAQLALNQAKADEGNAINALADMERENPGTTTVFGQLRDYYGQVKQASMDEMKESRAYQKELEASEAPMSYAGSIRDSVEADRQTINKLRGSNVGRSPGDDVQAAQEKYLVDYSHKMENWYRSQNVPKQIEEQRAMQQYLGNNHQFDYIDQLVEQAKAQGLDHK